MSIKESALSAITSITQSDFVRAVTAAGASRRITVANFAKAIIESYTGSSLAGSSQSVKSALDALNNKSGGSAWLHQQSVTIDFKSKNALLIGCGSDASTRFATIITGYTSAVEYKHILAPGNNVFSTSGTSVIVTNTNPAYDGRIAWIYL